MFSLKTLILACIISVALTGLFCYWMQSKNDGIGLLESQIRIIEQEKKELDEQIMISEGIIQNLNSLVGNKVETIDSLKSIIARIRRQSFQKQLEIDSLIAFDSSKAVEQYRLALETLGVIPDMADRLTLREIGYGAKFLFGYSGMQLQIHLQEQAFNELESLLSLKESIITEQINIISTSKKILKKTGLEVDLYKSAYEDATRFWANRISLVIGGTSNYVNGTVHFGVGATLGIKIWSNK